MSKNLALTDVPTLRKRARQLLVDDPTTRRMMEKILAVEEEHARDLADLLVVFPNASERTARSTKSK